MDQFRIFVKFVAALWLLRCFILWLLCVSFAAFFVTSFCQTLVMKAPLGWRLLEVSKWMGMEDDKMNLGLSRLRVEARPNDVNPEVGSFFEAKFWDPAPKWTVQIGLCAETTFGFKSLVWLVPRTSFKFRMTKPKILKKNAVFLGDVRSILKPKSVSNFEFQINSTHNL